MDQQNIQDKRQTPRWQIDRPCAVGLGESEARLECRIRDLSYRGARIILRRELPQDTFIKLQISLSSDCTFMVEAWIVWHKTIMEANSYGIYFSKISDIDKEKIYNFVLRNFGRLVYNQWYGRPERPALTDRPAFANYEHPASSERPVFISYEGGEEMQDRRVFSRFPAKLVVKFLDLTSNKEGLAESEDVSAKGLGLVTREELNVHTPLELWLKVPDNGEPLYTRGQVVWSRKAGANKFRSGVNLEKADLMAMSRILRVI